ncbi:MAG: hypothetical protein E7366_01695, partial [Clostridiales bacterium]|nr:hypothetical protein [Clostridiales bacterium]
MNQRAIEKTELNKILALVSEYAVLEGTKERLKNTQPTSVLQEARKRLKQTEEGSKLLFSYGISKVEYFSPFDDELQRAKKGSSLTCGELLKAENLLRSTRIAHTSICSVQDDEVRDLKT